MSDNNTYLYDRRSEIAELKRQRRHRRRKRAAAVFIVVLVIASLVVFFLRYNLPHKKIEMLGDVERSLDAILLLQAQYLGGAEG